VILFPFPGITGDNEAKYWIFSTNTFIKSTTNSRTKQDNMAAPLTLNTTHQGPWECDSFCNTFACPPHQPFQAIGGEFNCSGCILPFFEAALKFDHHWPARWGPDVLEPEMLAGLLWKRTAMQAEAERLAGRNPSGMEGQERGVDYQYCPRCKFTISLIDGCNHVLCRCGENFCFLCGESVLENSGHWEDRIGCPRWGIAYHEERVRVLQSATRWRTNMMISVMEYDVGRWVWFVAVQNSNSRLRAHMRQFVNAAPTHRAARWVAGRPATEHWIAVVHAMMAFNSAHGVTRHEWTRILNRRAEVALQEWEEGGMREFHHLLYPVGSEQPTGLAWGRLLTMGQHLEALRTADDMIRQPIGGLFDFSHGEGRQAAADWILRRLNSNTTDWTEPENYAIIARGPAGTEESQFLGAEILTTLRGSSGHSRLFFPHRRRAVKFLQRGSSDILVHVADVALDEHDMMWPPLAEMADASMPLETQDGRLASWLYGLLTDPMGVLRDVREANEEVMDMRNRPDTLYLHDEDVEMSDAGEEDEDDQVVAEVHL
jgi:hypothetical protein